MSEVRERQTPRQTWATFLCNRAPCGRLASEISACDFLQTNQLGDLAQLAIFFFRTIFVNVADA